MDGFLGTRQYDFLTDPAHPHPGDRRLAAVHLVAVLQASAAMGYDERAAFTSGVRILVRVGAHIIAGVPVGLGAICAPPHRVGRSYGGTTMLDRVTAVVLGGVVCPADAAASSARCWRPSTPFSSATFLLRSPRRCRHS